jgi:hypothetical protein
MAGNRRISRSGYDLKHKESSTRKLPCQVDNLKLEISLTNFLGMNSIGATVPSVFLKLRTRNTTMDMTMSSIRPNRVEVVNSVQRRRRWTPEEKLEIVKQTNEPGSSVSLVARTDYAFRI